MGFGKRTFHIVVTVLLIILSSAASAACLTSGRPIVGVLDRILERNHAGKLRYSYVLALDYKNCVRTPIKRKRQINDVLKLGLDIRNAKVRELNHLLGLRVSVRGLLRPASRKDRKRDALVHDGVILGSFDPRNNKFHKWSYLKRRIARISSGRYDETEGIYVTKDTTALNRLIKRSMRNYADGDSDKARLHRHDSRRDRETEFRRSSVYNDVLSFLIDDFLQFPRMQQAEVVEFYAPQVVFNGNGLMPRESAVRLKFSRFGNWPQHSARLVKRSIRIRKSRHYPGCYRISFAYVVNGPDGGRSIWFKEEVELLVDLDMNIAQIREERIRTL